MQTNFIEFNLNLSFNGQTINVAVPVGDGLPNYVNISGDHFGASIAKPSAPIATPVINHAVESSPIVEVPHEIKEIKEVDPDSGNNAPIIPVEVDELTEEILNKDREFSLESIFLTKYSHKYHLYKHMCQALSKHVEFSDLNKINLLKIKDYLVERVSANSVGLYLGTIKAIMNMFADEDVFNCRGFNKILRHKKCPSMNVFLTEDEIRKIEDYVPRTPTECDIKVMFLIEYYTGARVSDVMKMDINNIVDGKVVYISQKTNVLSKLPVHKNLKQLLEYKRTSNHSRTVYNRTIKMICKRVGINDETSIFYHGTQRKEPKWKFVGSHTARRSFATNLALRGVPINVISKMINHNGNTKMTEKYILADIEDMDDSAQAFFE